MELDKRVMAARIAGSVLAMITLAVGAAAQTAPQSSPQIAPLTMTTRSLPTGVAGIQYETRLAAEGGRTPYAWTLREGELPAGLDLNEKSGALTGVPTAAGEFHFTVAVADSTEPRNEVERQFTVVITTALTIKWIEPPHVVGEAIRGRLEVSNQTDRPFDQTVIVLAVNEVGKAFALGYQHFTLEPRTTSPPIPFESTMPFGTYVVHADGVGEVEAINKIYRARMQTDAMVVRQP